MFVLWIFGSSSGNWIILEALRHRVKRSTSLLPLCCSDNKDEDDEIRIEETLKSLLFTVLWRFGNGTPKVDHTIQFFRLHRIEIPKSNFVKPNRTFHHYSHLFMHVCWTVMFFGV